MLTETRVAPRASRRHLFQYAVAAGAFLAMAGPIVPMLDEPERAEITLENPHAWDIGVQLVLADGTRLFVTTVGDDSTSAVGEVLHPGATWRFVWRFAAADVDETIITDADLRAAGHSIRVPAEVARRLRADDAPPSP